MLKRLVQGVLFLAFVVLTSLLQEQKDSTDLMIAEATELLTVPSNPEVSPGLLKQGRLHISDTSLTLKNTDIERLLSKKRGSASAGSYTLRNSKTGTYTMIAPGVDQQYYLVNSFFDGYLPFRVENPVLALYAIAQRKRYQYDHITYPGRPEVWQSSRQAFYQKVGDCEDHAILLTDWLIGLGYDARVAVGDYNGEGHAWVVLFIEGKEYLLEATRKRGLKRLKVFPLASLQGKYHPVYMFNNEFFWQNTGSKFTTRYGSANWVKKSQYMVN
jgi:hypothetical protein